MLKIPAKDMAEFKGRFQTHKLNISASNIFYHMIQAINNTHSIVDRKTYQNDFLNALSDIELNTPPTDGFIPSEDGGHLFVPNRLAAEYIKITERLPLSLIEETYGPTNAMVILLKHDPKNMDKFYDDVYTYYSLFKYLDQIDMIRLNTYSNFTPIIEYIVNNITLDDWKQFLVSKRVNEEKYAKNCEDIIFNPDVSATYKFYIEPQKETTPKFDVVNLMMRLVTNMVVKTDIILILGVYLTIGFAMSDFNNDKAEDSPCAKYVREVLSKI